MSRRPPNRTARIAADLVMHRPILSLSAAALIRDVRAKFGVGKTAARDAVLAARALDRRLPGTVRA